MAYGPRHCACCGDILGVEEHHLYLRADGCPDDLTVWLCHHCHGRAHGMRRRINIRERTIAGLAAAKARGVKLGGYRHDGSNTKLPALERAEALRGVFAELAGQSHRGAAKALNARGIRTATGKTWTAVQVVRVRERLGLVG